MIPYQRLKTLARISRQFESLLSNTFWKTDCETAKRFSTMQAISPSSCFCACPVQQVLKTHSRHMAGHAHWRNIKNIKLAADSKYSAMVSSFTRKVRSAVKGKISFKTSYGVFVKYCALGSQSLKAK